MNDEGAYYKKPNLLPSHAASLHDGSGFTRRAMTTNFLPNWKNWKLRIAFGSAMTLLAFVGALSHRSITESNESARWVTHSRDVLKSLQLLRYSMEALTSNIRGFLITGRDSYLETYRANLAKLEQQKKDVRNLTADNLEQQRRLPALETLIARRIERADLLVSLQRTAGSEAAVESIRSGPGKTITDDFEVLTDQFQAEELRLLALRNADVKDRVARTKAILILGTLLGLVITGIAGWSVQRDSNKREQAEANLALKMKDRNWRNLLPSLRTICRSRCEW